MKYKALLGLRGIMGYVTKKLVKFVAEDTPAFNSALHSSFFFKVKKGQRFDIMLLFFGILSGI